MPLLSAAINLPEILEVAFRYIMLRSVGFLMQLAVLALLPMLILWQLMFGFRLILMPMLTLAGIVIFTTGQWMREGK